MEGIVGIYKGYKSHWGYVLALDIWENLGWVGEEAHFQPRKAEYLISGYTRYLWLAIFLKSHMQSCRQDIWLKGDFDPWQGKKMQLESSWKNLGICWYEIVPEIWVPKNPPLLIMFSIGIMTPLARSPGVSFSYIWIWIHHDISGLIQFRMIKAKGVGCDICWSYGQWPVTAASGYSVGRTDGLGLTDGGCGLYSVETRYPLVG